MFALCLAGTVVLFMTLNGAALADSMPKPVPVQLPAFPLGVVSFPNGKAINLSVNIGTSAFHGKSDPASRIWTVTDRGPVMVCGALKPLIGMGESELCSADAKAELAMLPSFAPTIYGLDLIENNTVQVSQTIALRGKTGKPVPGLFRRDTDEDRARVFGVDAQPIEPGTTGVNPTSIIRFQDGSFLVSERYGPSLLQIAVDGTILKRLVIAGTEADFDDSEYEVSGILPALLKQGSDIANFESMSVSADEQFIFLAIRGPLAATGAGTQISSTTPYLRIFKLERVSMSIIAQFVYTLDAPQRFAADFNHHPREQSDVRLSEMISLPTEKLLLVERVSRTARFFMVDMREAKPLASVFDTEIASPALEAMSAAEFAQSGIASLTKNLIYDTDSLVTTGISAKRIEGVARLSDSELVIVSNNAFGIEGDRTKMFRLKFPESILK